MSRTPEPTHAHSQPGLVDILTDYSWCKILKLRSLALTVGYLHAHWRGLCSACLTCAELSFLRCHLMVDQAGIQGPWQCARLTAPHIAVQGKNCAQSIALRMPRPAMPRTQCSTPICPDRDQICGAAECAPAQRL